MKLKQLHEHLQGIKKYQGLTWKEICSMLHDMGIELKGDGSFGQVFHKQGWKHVIKIFEKDDAYMKFVDYAISHPNKHFPKFKKKITSFKQFHLRSPLGHKQFHVVRIEQLYPLDTQMEDFLVWNLNAIISYYQDYDSDYNECDVKISTHDYHTFYSIDEIWQAYPFLESFVNAVIEVEQMNMKHDFELDFFTHHNIMKRSDGTLVISDPLADLNSLEDVFPDFRQDINVNASNNNKTIPYNDNKQKTYDYLAAIFEFDVGA